MKSTRLTLRGLSEPKSPIITKDILCSNASASGVWYGSAPCGNSQLPEVDDKRKENKIYIGVPDSAVNQNGHGFFCIDKKSFEIDVYFETGESCLDYIYSTGIAWTIRCYKQAIKDMRRAKTEAEREQLKEVANDAKRMILNWPQADNYRILLPKELEIFLGINTPARQRYTKIGLFTGVVRHEVYRGREQDIFVMREDELKLLKLVFLINQDPNKRGQPTKIEKDLREALAKDPTLTIDSLYASHGYDKDIVAIKDAVKLLIRLKDIGLSKNALLPVISEMTEIFGNGINDTILEMFLEPKDKPPPKNTTGEKAKDSSKTTGEQIISEEIIDNRKHRDRQRPNKKNVFAEFKCKNCHFVFSIDHPMILSGNAKGSKKNSLKYNPDCPDCDSKDTVFVKVLDTKERGLYIQRQ